MNQNHIIEIENIVKAFPTYRGEPFYALKGVSAYIPRGEFTVLKGRSGSGKTTLINMLGALDKPTEGKVFFDGREITALSESERELLRRTKMGFVFQSVSLIPMLNAYENVEFALRLSGIKENRAERVKECLRMVGLEKRMNHMPQELSGGEQQRVAIARAIVHKPRILFADEPTAELDSHSSKVVAGLFRELVEKEGITILMTTHDSSLMNAGTHLIELADGEVVNE
ncbi:MAG: ABC transporter ATP-binding protein [Lachnospiraceae bacterium]|nr:ABC transporter ATP-binding protein [Lachnospiraceae bacterium]